MLGGKYVAIALVGLLLLSTFRKFAPIIIIILLSLFALRLLADMYWWFKGGDKDDFW